MTLNLPEALTGSPDQEALALGLEEIVFAPLDEDEQQRQASDTTSLPLRAFALLDASQSPDIPICLEGFSGPARCLFDGAAYEDMAEVAPWLIELTRHSDAWDWFVEEGYGRNWGILIHSRLELPRLKTHLKKFLKIEDEDGERYFFKYYRPEHFNRYAPGFDGVQRASFWRGIEAVHAESKGNATVLMRHRLNKGGRHESRPLDVAEAGRPLLIRTADLGDNPTSPARG
ncbi:DUF4123 domain-containing protein [Paracoccus tegillarcae]|uniref:DUF4123 domain-containing protein n=1 Tax=Paracoccus tegillarcae TaxID=1529068 RepID=A0A2K9EDS2_9RHOB|nr:DUF4123 domain-containing protein [Paracoccus tegillarcae]AUH33090.1 hypothetical protein CUV01_06525 [Paracoccus tegillarcae]